MNMIMILIVDNIQNYKETFYNSILLPEDLQNKYNMLLLDKPKKMMKLSYCLKSYLANRLSLDNYSILYHEYGKPYLHDNNNGDMYEFNISHHKDDIALYYNNNQCVGIDILNINHLRVSSFDCMFFSSQEREFCTNTDNFSKIWTAKEAYGKFLGTGFDDDMCNVNLVPYLDGTPFHNRIFRFLNREHILICICEILND
jgi:phosphopantetheinyl transferase